MFGKSLILFFNVIRDFSILTFPGSAAVCVTRLFHFGTVSAWLFWCFFRLLVFVFSFFWGMGLFFFILIFFFLCSFWGVLSFLVGSPFFFCSFSAFYGLSYSLTNGIGR